MIDFKLALAQEVAEQIGAKVLPDRCCAVINNEIICGHPLVIKPDQDFPFCWFCVTDKQAAQRGRTALTKAKLASQGIFIEENLHPCPSLEEKPWLAHPGRIYDPEEETTNWPKGMAL